MGGYELQCSLYEALRCLAQVEDFDVEKHSHVKAAVLGVTNDKSNLALIPGSALR